MFFFSQNDDIYASGPFDPFSSSPATTSSPIQVGELRKKLQHSPSLDGVLDEPFSTSLRETPSRPLPLQHSTHFGGSDFDITTSSSTRVGAGGVNDVSSSMIDHTTLPTVLSHPTTNTSSSSNLQSFAPVRFLGAVLITGGPNGRKFSINHYLLNCAKLAPFLVHFFRTFQYGTLID